MKTRLLFLLLALAFVGCGKISKKSAKPMITVSVLPQKYIVEQIASNYFDVNVMVVPGASPATYSPSAKQMAQLDKSDVYLRIGHIGFEQTWVKKIKAVHRNLNIKDTSKGIKLLYAMAEKHGDHVHLHGIDPHVWMAPHSFRKLAENTFSILKQLAPSKEKEFKKGLDKLLTKIDKVSDAGKKALQSKQGKTFMIFHPALGYLAKEFGLNQMAMEIDGKEPSTKHLTQVVDEAKSKGIKAVFIQKEFSAEQAEIIANEINGEVIQIDPLAYDWPQEMTRIIDKLSLALN